MKFKTYPCRRYPKRVFVKAVEAEHQSTLDRDICALPVDFAPMRSERSDALLIMGDAMDQLDVLMASRGWERV